MAIAFFYGSIVAVWIVFLICTRKKSINVKNIMIAIAAIGYSLLFDTLLGEYFGLYHYINQSNSLIYIIISALLLYPVIEVIYTMFLPEGTYHIIIYTTVWILLLLAFELASLYTRTIIFTGWKVIPWSIVTYIFTFSWINLLFRYMKKRNL